KRRTTWCAPLTMRSTSGRRRDATGWSGTRAPNSTRTPKRARARALRMEQNPPPSNNDTPIGSATIPEATETSAATIMRLEGRIADLQRERDHLVAVVDILQEISSSLHFVDILQTIARKMGESFGLDRCSIFLSSGSKD